MKPLAYALALLAALLLAVVAQRTITTLTRPDAALEAALRRADSAVVRSSHGQVAAADARRESDSLAAVAGAIPTPRTRTLRVTDTLVLAGLPPIRDGWQGIVVQSGDDAGPDTLPTPRIVVRELVARDSAIGLLFTSRETYRAAYSKAADAHDRERAAHGQTQSALAATREALAIARRGCRVLGAIPCPVVGPSLAVVLAPGGRVVAAPGLSLTLPLSPR